MMGRVPLIPLLLSMAATLAACGPTPDTIEAAATLAAAGSLATATSPSATHSSASTSQVVVLMANVPTTTANGAPA